MANSNITKDDKTNKTKSEVRMNINIAIIVASRVGATGLLLFTQR